jgi:membrane-bound lytic murein transglycosylase D
MWQFIPSTGKNFGLKQDWMADNRRDVLLSTHAALDYLQKLYGMFNSWELAFAAYNCGEGCVARAIQKNERKRLPTDFLSLKLPPETRQYVPKLLAVKNIVLAPANFGIALDTVHNRPYFGKVTAPAKIDVKLAARLAEMPEDEFAALNPAFNRPVASSETGYFLVPADKAETFRDNMALYQSLDGPLVSWQTINAKRGEAVESVARRYGLTASYLRATHTSLPEKKGKFTQNTSIMVPMQKEAKIIMATLDRREALRQSSSATSALELVPGEPIREEAFTATNPATISVATDLPDEVVAPVLLASAPMPSSYQVVAGDTLFSIARKYGLSVDQIKAQNRLAGTVLQTGQRLHLDAVVTPVAELSIRAVAPAAPPAHIYRGSAPSIKNVAPSPRTYVVRAGDSLFAIAQKFGVELDDLLRWNRLNGRTVIQPGLKIRLASL